MAAHEKRRFTRHRWAYDKVAAGEGEHRRRKRMASSGWRFHLPLTFAGSAGDQTLAPVRSTEAGFFRYRMISSMNGR